METGNNHDKRTVMEEVVFLVDGGYRANDRDDIMVGLYIADRKAGVDDWKRWANMKLKDVIEDFRTYN